MKKRLFLFALCVYAAIITFAAGRRVTFNVDVTRPMNSAPSELTIGSNLLSQAYGLSNFAAVDKALSNKTLYLAATYFTNQGNERFSLNRNITSGYGHWFNNLGIPTSSTSSRVVNVEFANGTFKVSHDARNATEGGEYVVKESFICPTVADTITYVFNVRIGGEEASISSDQKDLAFGRKDYTDSWFVKPLVRENEQDWNDRNWIQVDAGNDVTLSASLPEEMGSAKYAWLNAQGKVIRSYKNTADYQLSDVTEEDAGMYTLRARLTKNDGTVTVAHYHYFIDVQTERGQHYDWLAHTTKFEYDFRSEFPALPEPQKIHTFYKRTANGGKAPANYYAGKWWSAFWGDNLNPDVGTDSASIYATAKAMVDYFDQEFAYLRDKMGWPPDRSAREGYKSFIYVFGSGLTNDNSPNTEMGGYQGFTDADGEGWACVWASYVPFAAFRADRMDYWQMNALVHEGIHATCADMPGVKGSSWFHEAGNVYAQGKMTELKALEQGIYDEADDARAGWLEGGPLLAPFQPIECYSGWLQDGSFGGPQAQGVNRYNDKGQICTWRTYLGGSQYCTAFPYILASFAGTGSIPWIWRYCDYRVLEGIGDSIGDEAMRKVIQQYRSRMAIYDFGYGWKSYRNVMNDNFGNSVGPENMDNYWVDCGKWKMTPYAKPTLNDEDGWLAPDTLTNPGWSGANFIPIHVDPTGSKAKVEFRPEDTNMRAQLCYRTKDGTAYYSQPVFCGEMEIDITDRPANDVIMCVVCNTDYIYDDDNGDWQRSHHWDYRIRLGEGAWAVADPYQRWHMFEQNITDPTYDPTAITVVEEEKPGQPNTAKGIYNLNGQKLNRLQRGINIVNGKKVFIK